MKRRSFLKKTSISAAGMLLSGGYLAGMSDPERYKLTVLHTNDVHSRLDPFPMDGSRLQGLGGVTRRAAMIQRIRQEEPQVLLLDAGDMLQGTPYFNVFEGAPEFTSMSRMGYDVGILGNHDFDGGLELLDKQWHLLDLPILNANYNVQGTVLEGRVTDYRIIEKGPIRIGIFGLGIELEGLVPASLHGGVRYENPLPVAERTAQLLKKKGCHLVICLSHLGYEYPEEDRISDILLGEKTRNIDIIIGGHTHTFLDQPTVVRNADGEAVYIGQVGWAGVILGRMDIWFEKNYKRKWFTCSSTTIGDIRN
ncbi:MAG: metallophosphoesterase [Saprospiraceae bacterium]|nr:metallophosphoesterase [Saprospiraceae bacterium]